jgi:hypothetical protein
MSKNSNSVKLNVENVMDSNQKLLPYKSHSMSKKELSKKWRITDSNR